MAVRRNNQDLDQQLDLFTARRPTHDTIDPVRTDGPRNTGSEHCPTMVRELEGKGQLHQMLLEAEEKTKDERS